MRALYRGNVNTWECDENGHLNVKFYSAKVGEGIGVLAEQIGLGRDALASLGARLSVDEQHIRFLREVHPGAALYGRGGVVEAGENALRIYVELINGYTDDVSATFNQVVRLRDIGSNKVARLPEAALALSSKNLIEVPNHGAARSIDLSLPSIVEADAPSLAATDTMGLTEIMRGTIQPQDCDPHGIMKTENYIGRISDGIVNIARVFRVQDSKKERSTTRYGGAVLEYWLRHHEPYRTGDIVVARSGLKHVGDKANTLVHWMFNGVTGQLMSSSEAVAITLDLDARKVVSIPDDRRAHLETLVVPGLAS